jgi:hypothetical protein
MTIPCLLNEFVLVVIGPMAGLLLRISGESVRVPQSCEDFVLF